MASNTVLSIVNIREPEREELSRNEAQVIPSELFPMESVQLGWRNTKNVGAGMYNMGNTCYLNSALQAMFHVPSLVNWLTSPEEYIHAFNCQGSDSNPCVICAVRKTLEASQLKSDSSIFPKEITNILTFLSREFQFGRQQDSQEFLRCLSSRMEEAFLGRFKNQWPDLDEATKLTTPPNQIFGGFLESSVICDSCSHVSKTSQHFQELVLDIENAETVYEAVEGFLASEELDSYSCENCKQKGTATKQWSFQRLPKVLCLQLQRFSVFTNNKIMKHVSFPRRLNLGQYTDSGTSLIYRFASSILHHGCSINRGHYTAIAQAPSGSLYQFDDDSVTEISHRDLKETNAYVIFYELESHPKKRKSVSDHHDNKDDNITISSTNNGERSPMTDSQRSPSLGDTQEQEPKKKRLRSG